MVGDHGGAGSTMADDSRRLSILIGITSKSWGGNEKWASEAARGLAERGHRVCVFWTHEPVFHELEARGLDARRLNLWGDLNPVGLRSLARLMKDVRPDVLMLTKQREYWMGGLTARFVGSPLVVLRFGSNRPLVNDLKRRLAFGKFADAVIVNSHLVKDTITTAPWLSADKVFVLHNGVETSAPRPEAGRAFLESVGVPSESPVVVGAGRLMNVKGFDILIEAFSTVLADFPNARLVILGEGGRRDSLARAAARLGIERSVLLPGHSTDVRDVLSQADVYVLSSRYEGMANTLLEAMSVGAPIVATDVSGTTEAVRPYIDALVVPPDDRNALAASMARLLADRELAAKLGESARDRARESFGMDRMVTELEKIIVSSLARRAGGGRPRAGLHTASEDV